MKFIGTGCPCHRRHLQLFSLLPFAIVSHGVSISMISFSFLHLATSCCVCVVDVSTRVWFVVLNFLKYVWFAIWIITCRI